MHTVYWLKKSYTDEENIDFSLKFNSFHNKNGV